MSRYPKQMRSCAIGLLLLASLLFPPSSFAQEICFSNEVASRMVVLLEQGKIAEQQLTVAAGSNLEIQQQTEILKTSIKLLEDQIQVYKNMDEMKAKMMAAKDRLHEEQLKAAQPTFMDKVKDNVLAGSIGAALCAVAFLLL